MGAASGSSPHAQAAAAGSGDGAEPPAAAAAAPEAGLGPGSGSWVGPSRRTKSPANRPAADTVSGKRSAAWTWTRAAPSGSAGALGEPSGGHESAWCGEHVECEGLARHEREF